MSKKNEIDDIDTEALFILSTTWIPKDQVASVEKHLKKHLTRLLYKMNTECKPFIVDTTTQIREE